MLIEAIKPLKVKLPTGDVHLTPGVPVKFPTIHAKQLLAKAHGKVRVLEPPKPDWLSAWRELASLTYGITVQDPRFGSIMDALNICDEAYLGDDWTMFQHGQGLVRQILDK